MKLMEYCNANRLNNVDFFGSNDKDDIIDIYRTQGDLVNILRADTVINKNALPNKLYEAAVAGVPVVVYEHNSVISEYVHQYYLGIVLKGRSELEQMERLLEDFDYSAYSVGRKSFLDYVPGDIDIFEETVESFVNHTSNISL